MKKLPCVYEIIAAKYKHLYKIGRYIHQEKDNIFGEGWASIVASTRTAMMMYDNWHPGGGTKAAIEHSRIYDLVENAHGGNFWIPLITSTSGYIDVVFEARIHPESGLEELDLSSYHTHVTGKKEPFIITKEWTDVDLRWNICHERENDWTEPILHYSWSLSTKLEFKGAMIPGNCYPLLGYANRQYCYCPMYPWGRLCRHCVHLHNTWKRCVKLGSLARLYRFYRKWARDFLCRKYAPEGVGYQEAKKSFDLGLYQQDPGNSPHLSIVTQV